jgi:hypothetical protein
VNEAYMGGGMVVDPAGHPMGSGGGGQGEGPGANNERRVGAANVTGGVGARLPSDPAGHPMGSPGRGSGETTESAATGNTRMGVGTGGVIGGSQRPNPPVTAPGGVSMRGTANPANEPVGGGAQGTQPGFTQNR